MAFQIASASMIASKDTLEPKSSDYVMPNSQRVYVEGEIHPEVRVPFREISLAPTKDFDGQLEPNEPVRVYDSSGPWGDPQFTGDSSKGLPALRAEWIRARGDVAEYDGREVKPQDNGYLTRPRRIRQQGRAPIASSNSPARDSAAAAPRQRRPSRHAALVCAPGHHHARDGIHRHPREHRPRKIAGHEAQDIVRNRPRQTARRLTPDSGANSLAHQHPRRTLPRSASPPRSRPSSSAPKSPPAAPSSRPTSITPSSSR